MASKAGHDAVMIEPDEKRAEHCADRASAQSNVGLSTGIVDASLPLGGKLILIVLMVTGRLEIFPIMLLVAWFFGRR